MSFSERRCRMTEHLASAWWHLTQEGTEAPRDIQVILEHRLRDVLTDGDCPSCTEVALAKELDASLESGEEAK